MFTMYTVLCERTVIKTRNAKPYTIITPRDGVRAIGRHSHKYTERQLDKPQHKKFHVCKYPLVKHPRTKKMCVIILN